MRPKIIFIDWSGTLSNSKFWQQLSDPKNKLNKFNPLIESWFLLENNKLLNDWMLGKKDAKQVCEILGTNFGISPKLLFEKLIYSCRRMKLFDKKVKKVVQKLRSKGAKVLVASDNMDVFRDFTIPALKLESIFDGFLLSNEIGCYKYSVRDNRLLFFESYLAAQNKTYQDVVLLDDSPDRFDVFKNFGFPLVKIAGPEFLCSELERLLL